MATVGKPALAVGPRTAIGALLGFTLACALAGLYVHLGPQAPGENLIVALMAMLPLWLAGWACAYLPATTWRAAGWLLAANLLAQALLWLARAAGGAA